MPASASAECYQSKYTSSRASDKTTYNMATTQPESGAWRKEEIFANYSADQGKTYDLHRPTYHASVFSTVLEHHKSGGGGFETLLDVRINSLCVTCSLVPYRRVSRRTITTCRIESMPFILLSVC